MHTVRKIVEEGDPEVYVLQVDLQNAFNLANRDTALEEMETHCPEGLSWAMTCYGGESELLFGDKVISSSTGFHQGDPLAGDLFSLNLQPVVLKIQEEVPSLKANTWYHDDGHLAGRREELRKGVDILKREGPSRGLYLSDTTSIPPPGRPKSVVWCPAGSIREVDPLQCGIPQVEEAGIMVLGAPVGSLDFERVALEKRILKVKNITDTLPLLKDPHTEFVLLRSCLSLPKVMYNLRTVDPSNHQALWKEFDSNTREALSRILGTPPTDLQWQQAKLPVSQGGVGLRAAEDHGPAAYSTSFLAAQPLAKDLLQTPEEERDIILPQALLQLLSFKQGEDATTESLEGVTQKMASYTIDLHNRNLLTDHYTRVEEEREMARLASVALPHAGDWLNVVPSPALCLHLRPLEFVMSLKYRLGMALYTRAGQCPACNSHSDELGDHAMCCGSKGERIARHNNLRDLLHQTAVSAALAPTKEGRFLLPDTERRPADIFIPHWTAGRDTALDVTVVNPLQQATVSGASTTPGFALTYAYNIKMRKSDEECRKQGITFLPLAAESLGGWHEVAVEQIKKLAAALSRQTGQEEQEAKQQLFEKLSVLLMKGNCALFTNRMPED